MVTQFAYNSLGELTTITDPLQPKAKHAPTTQHYNAVTTIYDFICNIVPAVKN